MTDAGRQSFTDKAEAALKPDSQKSTTEQAGDTVKGKADSAGSTFQPSGEKSTTQKATDSMTGNSNENHESLIDKAKGTLGMNK
ncbi:heat shock protein 9/12-domain-containing protein [Schizophyllum amplum]|uniref:Heat shock protein 9/12-domain-containing protein n=1 Tax=Schizophyllum amplum TaxID=97359 RepID=A0A550CJU6_9AGAR|nr:heat shock protein 9/12-domain-containing protein [Auriculariopsis ampla]